MIASTILDTVKGGFAQARTTLDIVTAHSAQAFSTGVQTLEQARTVVVTARTDTAAVLARARDELVKTFADGASSLGDQLVRIATPTHKEQAELRKAEVRRKKQAKREEAAHAEENLEQTAAQEG